MADISAKISAYEAALKALAPQPSEDYPDQVMALLKARDDISHSLNQDRRVTASLYQRIGKLDKELKGVQKRIVDVVTPETFANWRNLSNPPADAWWWFLDERVAAEEERRSTFLTLLAALFITVAISLITDISRRFLSGEGDWLDIINAFAQPVLTVLGGILALLAGTSLTQPGHQLIEGLILRLGVFKGYKARKRVAIAGLILLTVLALRLSLPFCARFYNNRGFDYEMAADLSAARENYKRALSLRPSYAEAHYNLAGSYEGLQQDEAIKEYVLAIKYDSKLFPAYISLARLYILRGKDNDYSDALNKLQEAQNLSPADTRVQYALYKNLGWANYNLKYYSQAIIYLEQAIELAESEGGSAAHCLLARVLRDPEVQKMPGGDKSEAKIMRECLGCLRPSSDEQDIDKTWREAAKEYINQRLAQEGGQ